MLALHRAGGSLLLATALLAGCAAPRPRSNSLLGTPYWYPLGAPLSLQQSSTSDERPELAQVVAEAYFAGDADRLAAARLSFVPGPRYFDGVASPRVLDGLPTDVNGARLTLDVAVDDLEETLVLTLTLTAGDRDLVRAVEHRFTNIVPFLFAIYADGESPMVVPAYTNRLGGVRSAMPLVAAGESRAWRLTVELESLLALFDGAKPAVIHIVAAFSERQHDPCWVAGELPEPRAHLVGWQNRIQRLCAATPWPCAASAGAGGRQRSRAAGFAPALIAGRSRPSSPRGRRSGSLRPNRHGTTHRVARR